MNVPNRTRGLNKRRHAMPQISDFDKFSKDLEKNEIQVITLSVEPRELAPTQGNFNEDKVKTLIQSGAWNKKPIISSNDDFVVDGHHRWLAAVELKKKIETRVIDLPIDDLLKFLKGKPYVKSKTINEDVVTEAMSDTLSRVQSYYSRVAKGEGGERFASVLNRASAIRQLIQDNKDSVSKKRNQILNMFDKIEAMINDR